MQTRLTTLAAALAVGSGMVFGAAALAQSGGSTDTTHAHAHDHARDHGHADPADAADADAIYRGYFEDNQIAPRSLSDWEGEWQSVYPLLIDGTLDPVMVHKAKHGDKTVEEYRAYYQIGCETDVDRIEIRGDVVRFHTDDATIEGHYAAEGYEILTYEKGNRGVRFIFAKTGGDAEAPEFIQFSDHIIAPQKAGHYHLYWGDDRAALLEELTNWPTYYPSSLTADEIVAEMTAH